jgi:nitrite reductase/ring-hydroxylating ferredoxin subunit
VENKSGTFSGGTFFSGTFSAVCRLDALADPGAREFLVGEGDWPFRGLVVRKDGAVRAYANWCPHKGHPLNLAEDDFLAPVPGGGQLLRCASHGALFVPENGLCVVGPCAGRSLRSLECRVEGGVVLVRSPDSATAGAASAATSIPPGKEGPGRGGRPPEE